MRDNNDTKNIIKRVFFYSGEERFYDKDDHRMDEIIIFRQIAEGKFSLENISQIDDRNKQVID